MAHIFEYLQASGCEHSVKCSFLELYNEEITDLLAPEPEVDPAVGGKSAARKVSHNLMEDGKGGVAVKGLEEVIVHTPAEIFDYLSQGSSRRRTAETLCNKQSSRSHSVFSVTIHMKESTPEGEDLIKCGKLNLVDLAGSENISRSGAKDSRAREAGEINKSLLTLGRVITALVDRLGHVPYRDSKLTRLLRDALGGKSKTCIIATISPASHALEETLSTLEYAHRAKSIKNKPEVNQRLTKTALIKDMNNEIDRLRADLAATREKNGIYMSQASYDQSEEERATFRRRTEELEGAIALTKSELANVTALFETTKKAHTKLQRENAETVAELGTTRASLATTTQNLEEARVECEESSHLLDAFERAQERLHVKTGRLADHLATSKTEVEGLFGKLERKAAVEDANKATLGALAADLVRRLEKLESSLLEVQAAEEAARDLTRRQLADFMKRKEAEVEALRGSIGGMRAAVEKGAAAAAQCARDAAVAAAGSLETQAAEESAAAADYVATANAAAESATAALTGVVEALSSEAQGLEAFAAKQAAASKAARDAAAGLTNAATSAMGQIKTAAAEATASATASATEAKAMIDAAVRAAEARASEERESLMNGVAALVAKFVAGQSAAVREAAASAALGVDAGAAAVASAADRVDDVATSATAQIVACDAEASDAKARVDAASEGIDRALATARAGIDTATEAAAAGTRTTEALVASRRTKAAVSLAAAVNAARSAGEAAAVAADAALEASRAEGAAAEAALSSHLENDTAAVHEMGVVAAEQSEHTIALAASQSEAAAAVRESLVAALDSLAVDAPTGGTPARATAGTLLATPVARKDIAAMLIEREAALAAFRAGQLSLNAPDGDHADVEDDEAHVEDGPEETADVDPTADADPTATVESAEAENDASEEQGAAATASEEEVPSAAASAKVSTRSARSTRSTRSAMNDAKTPEKSRIPRAPLRNLSRENSLDSPRTQHAH